MHYYKRKESIFQLKKRGGGFLMAFQFLRSRLLLIFNSKPFSSLALNAIIIYGLSFCLRFVKYEVHYAIIVLCMIFFSMNFYSVFKCIKKKNVKIIIIFILTYFWYLLNMVLNFYYESIVFQDSELIVFSHVLLKVVSLCPVIFGYYILKKK